MDYDVTHNFLTNVHKLMIILIIIIEEKKLMEVLIKQYIVLIKLFLWHDTIIYDCTY